MERCMKTKPTISELRNMIKESYERFKPTMKRLQVIDEIKYFKARLNLGIPYGDIFIAAQTKEEALSKLRTFDDQTAKIFGGYFTKQRIDEMICEDRIFPITVISEDNEITIHRR
jgi:hypothetical protein